MLHVARNADRASTSIAATNSCVFSNSPWTTLVSTNNAFRNSIFRWWYLIIVSWDTVTQWAQWAQRAQWAQWARRVRQWVRQWARRVKQWARQTEPLLTECRTTGNERGRTLFSFSSSTLSVCSLREVSWSFISSSDSTGGVTRIVRSTGTTSLVRVPFRLKATASASATAHVSNTCKQQHV